MASEAHKRQQWLWATRAAGDEVKKRTTMVGGDEGKKRTSMVGGDEVKQRTAMVKQQTAMVGQSQGRRGRRSECFFRV